MFCHVKTIFKLRVAKQHEPCNKLSGPRFRVILPNCIASLPCHTSYMHHARSFAVVLNSASGVSSSVLLLHGLGRRVDASVPDLRMNLRQCFQASILPLSTYFI